MRLNDLYAYNGKISDDLEELETDIAENEPYAGEEGLMNIFENEIELLDNIDDLVIWCYENAYTVEELIEEGLEVFKDE